MRQIYLFNHVTFLYFDKLFKLGQTYEDELLLLITVEA